MKSRRLVWLHGFTGSPRAFEPVLAQLHQQRYGTVELYAPAIGGHDASDEQAPRSRASLGLARPSSVDADGPFEAEVDRLAAWLLERGWQRGPVCGYSLGGRLALGLLARHPELVSRLWLLSVNPGLSSTRARRERRASDARWIELLRREGVERFYERWRAQPLFASQSQLPSLVQQWQAQLRGRHQPEGLAQCLARCGLAEMPDYRPQVKDAPVPIHWAAGSRDAKFCALAREMAASHPRSTIEIVDGAGHNLVLEAPGAVARMIIRPNGTTGDRTPGS